LPSRQLTSPSTYPRSPSVRRPVFLTAILPGIVPGWAAAQTAAIPEAPVVSGGAILQMLFGLALVIGLLFIGFYLLHRLNGGRTFGHGGPLRIVGGLMLSPRERIVLLEIGETWVVVGIVPGQIKTLHTLPRGELPAGNEAENRFGVWLKTFTGRRQE
jgi:flagellar protein FliO/FliZ